MPLVRQDDALLVAGGEVLYLCHWMRESGLADLLESLRETVWVGLRAGSMVLTPTVGDDFIQWRPPNGDETALGVVDFSISRRPDGAVRLWCTTPGAAGWVAFPGKEEGVDAMTKYLISFPSGAMDIADGDLKAVSDAAHAVVEEAKAAGVWVFGGGIDESVPPVLVEADGTVTEGTYPQTKQLEGGYSVLELPSREAALEWAAKIAGACRCAQEVRAFGDDPAS